MHQLTRSRAAADAGTFVLWDRAVSLALITALSFDSKPRRTTPPPSNPLHTNGVHHRGRD